MTERAFLVLSALGPDRPGLVAEVTRYLTERGGNVEDSRMAVLGGEFGIMILLSGTREQLETITRETSRLEQATGLGVLTRSTTPPETARKSPAHPYRVSASALDHEGIVHAVSDALYRTGINILSLETASYNAPETGSPLFRLAADIELPEGTSPEQVRQALDGVAREEGLDIEIASREP
ncbi:MAG: transcriptional regulator [Armatimonadetes bacterium]|nr:transcriptional regulator [Armatimonadota bacterium]